MRGDRARLRSLLGASTALWAGEDGVAVQPGRWVALSHAPSVDYNVALCHGADSVAATLEEVTAARVPALIMLTGAALADAGRLVDAAWVCVGAVPFMARELAAGPPPEESAPRPLRPAELPLARALIARAFDVTPELAAIALPASAIDAAGRSVWGAHADDGTLLAALASVHVEDAVVVWSMASAAERRREGHGTRLLEAALAAAAARGARVALLHASPAGEPFYRARGYVELERWQLWSRPRWLLAHS